MAKKTPGNVFDRIPFRMHPRVFAALGADLVTNDVVAVIELVKNSYDAFANKVWVRFSHDEAEGTFLEIEDDGQGMTREIIEDVWCLVATPFRERNPKATSGKKSSTRCRRKRARTSFRVAPRRTTQYAHPSAGFSVLGVERQLVETLTGR